MLVETKARVGVFAIALGAYLPQFPSLVPEFQSQYQTFKTMIPDSVELIDGGIVTTPYGSYVIVMLHKEFSDKQYYPEHPATVYGGRVSRLIFDQYLALEGRIKP